MDVENPNSGQLRKPTTVDKLLSTTKSPKDYSYDSDSDDPYAGDHFRIYEFKIRRCNRSRSHDWTDCPFSHPGEKALRRDPLRYHYTGEICPEFHHGGVCSRGDECGFSHGVFECWLHPNRYRTEACKDGKHCKRKVCFFAHSSRQLRILPPSPEIKFSGVGGANSNRCCLFCANSPTSTLMGLSRSPSSSPPLSPANKVAAFSRLSHRCSATDRYKDLISSLDFLTLTEAMTASSQSPATIPVSTAETLASRNHHNRLPPRLDIRDRDLQFALSPSSTSSYLHSQLQPPPPPSFFSDESTPRGGYLSDFTEAATTAAEARDRNSFEVSFNGDLDLGWVNDLLT